MLHEYVELSRQSVIELLDDSRRNSIAKPPIVLTIHLALIRVPDFIGHKWLESEISNVGWMIDLQAVAVDVEIGRIGSDAPFVEVPVGEDEVSQVALEGRSEDESLLVDDPSRIGLVLDPEVGRHDRQMGIDLEGIPDAESLIDRTLPVSTLSDDSKEDDVLLLIDVFRQLEFAPELVVLAGGSTLRHHSAAARKNGRGQ